MRGRERDCVREKEKERERQTEKRERKRERDRQKRERERDRDNYCFFILFFRFAPRFLLGIPKIDSILLICTNLDFLGLPVNEGVYVWVEDVS